MIEIGDLPIRLRCDSSSFVQLMEGHYAGFLSSSVEAFAAFDIELTPPGTKLGPEEVRVNWADGQWLIEGEDFCAWWNPSTARGHIQQTTSVYALDCVLQVVHTLLLARRGGFLLCTSSVAHNGGAFLFSGISDTGNATIFRSAPSGTVGLTDGISYVIRRGPEFSATGTPFQYERGLASEKLERPIKALYLLALGSNNKVEPIEGAAAAQAVLESLVFFVRDPELVKLVFNSACDFVNRVPVRRVTCVRYASIWELIV